MSSKPEPAALPVACSSSQTTTTSVGAAAEGDSKIEHQEKIQNFHQQSLIPTDLVVQTLADSERSPQAKMRRLSRLGSMHFSPDQTEHSHSQDARHDADSVQAELAALAPHELGGETMSDAMSSLFDLSDSILPHMLNQQRTEMMVIPYEDWQNAKHIPRSSENLTRPVWKSAFGSTTDDLVVFITHRWWNPAQKHPDDEHGSKYAIISNALEEMIRTSGVDLETTNVVIWIDYACIDQDDSELQSRGIASLVSYAARADGVLTPVQVKPEAIDAFSTATHPTDLENYGERAWCRLESYMFTCVSEILMRPIHLFGYGMVNAAPAAAMACNCFSKVKVKPPVWTLKRLTDVGEEGIDMIEEKIRSTHRKVPHRGREGSGHSEEVLSENVLSRRSGSMKFKNTSQSLSRAGSTISREDIETSGAAFAKAQLPSHGELTVESDREVIRSIEQNLMNSYVHFAILFQCTLIRCTWQNEMEKPLTFSLRGKQVRSNDLLTLQNHLNMMPFVSRITTLDLSHNLLDKTNIKEVREVWLRPILPTQRQGSSFSC